MNIKGVAALEKKEKLVPYSYDAGRLLPFDVRIKIWYCGICHSDIHLIDDDWKISHYPLLPGHEIVGEITEIGSSVTHLVKGQRVGVGWQRKSCQTCCFCFRGEENLCLKQEATCVDHPGGFADYIQIDSRFVFPIPEKIASEEAAPLFCGGITVFSPLLQYKIDAFSKVGVFGIGGLGHLAIQFASKMGAHVTAFSSSPKKEKEVKNYGASAFLSSIDPKSWTDSFYSFDLLLISSTKGLSWDDLLKLLKPKGVLCLLGAIDEINLHGISLIAGRKKIAGSNIGSCPDIRKMLTFAEEKNIRPQVEVFPLEKVNEAIEKVKNNQVRYRAVLKIG